MKEKFPKRICAARDCEKEFKPKYRWELYHSAKCASRERQARYQERQKAQAAQLSEQTA